MVNRHLPEAVERKTEHEEIKQAQKGLNTVGKLRSEDFAFDFSPNNPERR